MTDTADSAEKLQAYIAQLRYAVATTSCRETKAMLLAQLYAAEARLQRLSRAMSSALDADPEQPDRRARTAIFG